MLARNHIVIGVASWLVIANQASLALEPTLQGTALATLGCLSPDIDHPQSWLGRRLPGVSHLVSFATGHRGLTHSATMLAVCVVVIIWLGLEHWMTPFCIGFASHIAADWFTRGGVPLFWPLKRRFRAPLSFKTGGVVEYVFSGLVLVVVTSIYSPVMTEFLKRV